MTMHDEIKLRKEHRKITDNHEHSNFMISSRSSEIESGYTKYTLLDVGKDLIVGREEEKKRMASLLESMPEKIAILPICGIGGIGKTTFARLIYNDTNFKHYSQVWVHVSSRFDLCKIGNSIISQLSGMKNQVNELQLIKNCLTRLFSGKKILIVLDDLWENNSIQLMDLKDMLNPVDSINIIVLVTTRSEDIAKKICSNIEPYKIESLTDDMCWDIIKQKSGFEARHDKEKLVGIGKEIARKCGGVALAAQTLGSMLHSTKYDQWMIVKDSDIWNETISKDASPENHVLASLKLSYFSMDDCLKSCFTYCAIFPKGHEIVKYDLIYQWLSLGFIEPTKMLSTYQLCEKYIVHLLGLTFLQHSMSRTTYGTYGEDGTLFTMHDLVHDLAVSLNTGPGSSCRYALLTDDCSKALESCTSSPAGLSALRFLYCWITELHGATFEHAKSLRVLDLKECSIQKLPESIGRLKQLRYLNAPRIRHHMVPECITKLSNLRYLKLCGSWTILALPESIGEMEGLVHLDLSGCIRIGELPKSFGDLKSLEHLDFAKCRNVMGVSECLGRLTKLQHLNLSNCGNIGDLPKSLGSLTKLKYLNLSNSSYLFGNKHADAEFLGTLTKLKYLDLSSSDKQPTLRLSEAIGSLTKLEYLNISRHYMTEKLAISFGNLCNLMHLDLSHCTQFLFVDRERVHEIRGNLRDFQCSTLFPFLGRICTLSNLEYLNLSWNDDLENIPETLANLKKLHTLDLSFCWRLRRLPGSISELVSLKFLNTMGCRSSVRSAVPWYNTDDSDVESSSFGFQLEHINLTQLKISRLENVKSEREAQTIKLVEKTDITYLELEWTRDVKRFVDDAKILRELEPPFSVSEFHLKGYNSFSFPSWVMHIGAYVPDVTRIEMSDLPSCNNLPPLGQLPNLKWLKITRMDSIKKIDADLYGGTQAFPRLVHFHIHGMKCLEEWNTDYSSDGDGCDEPLFPCLEDVDIRHCPKLRFKPRPPPSNSLRVDSSNEVMLSSWGNRSHVLGSSPATRLHVERCVVPLHRWSLLLHFPCLHHLTIINCSYVTCRSLEFLRGLTSLQTLTLQDCEWTTSLAERLGDLACLTELRILDCRGIKTLPDTIQKLTRLQNILIFGCPELVWWCKSEENKMKLASIKMTFLLPELLGDENSETDEESENSEESENEELQTEAEET